MKFFVYANPFRITHRWPKPGELFFIGDPAQPGARAFIMGRGILYSARPSKDPTIQRAFRKRMLKRELRLFNKVKAQRLTKKAANEFRVENYKEE
jgi:hypothetical protein